MNHETRKGTVGHWYSSAWPILLAVVLASLSLLTFLGPFNPDAEKNLFTQDGLISDYLPTFYRQWWFVLSISIWACGMVFSVGLFFRDLFRIADGSDKPLILLSHESGAKGKGAGGVLATRSRRSAQARWLVLKMMLGLGVRYMVFLYVYYLGVRALDIEGMMTEGSTLVRFAGFSAFSQSAQYLLVSFFNTVSFVGEFATFKLRSGWDALFTVVNVVARFFAVFLTLNSVFLRLNIVGVRGQEKASEPNTEEDP